MIHKTVIHRAHPFWYDRAEDGTRTPRKFEKLRTTIVGKDVDIFPLVCIVSGTQRPTMICDRAKIGPRAQIGHDALIGADTVIGAGAIICGLAEIGNRCTLGAGAIVTPEVKIGDDCFIGAGVVVSKDVPPNTKITLRQETCTRRNWEHLPWSGSAS